jgi:hypothetical protein
MPGTARKSTEAAESGGRNTLLRKAYGAASQDLREAHREEFDGYYEKRAAEQGVEWHPKPTAEQKAEDALRRLLADHPDVAQRVLAEGEATTPDEV